MTQSVSEKRVNIKIVASTTEFNNAMKKAQKQIEGLAESIDSLGSSKFGEKLEGQFDGLVKAAKKVESQITDMLGSLNDLGKTKLGKVDKELDDIFDASKKLNKTLEDTTDSIDDINKSKFNKIENQFKDIIDSSKDFNEKAEDIIDLLDKVDKQDLKGLEKEFDKVKDALEKISKETKDSTDDMEKCFREVADEVDRFIRELDNVEDTKLENLEESIKDIDKYIDEARESVSDFNKETNDLDDKEIDEFLNSLIDVTRAGDDVRSSLKKAFGSLDGNNLDFNISGKDKNGIVSDLAGELLGATLVGNKLEKAMEGVADSIGDIARGMDKLDDSLDATKSIDELGEEYKEAENAMEKLTEEYDDLIKKQKECEETVEKSNKAVQEQLNREHELADALSKVNKEIADYESKMDNLAKVVNDFNDKQNSLNAELDDVNKAIEKQEGIVNQVGKEYDEATEKILGLSKELEDYSSQLEDAEKKEKALADEWSKVNGHLEDLQKRKESLEQMNLVLQEQRKDAENAAKAYNDMGNELDRLRKEAQELEVALEDAMNEGMFKDLQAQADRFDLGRVKKQGQEAAEEIEKTKERMAELNKEAQGHADDFDKQYKAYEKLSQKVKEYLENEENGILLREKVAKSFREVSDSMEAVYKDASKLNNADIIDKTLLEAAEHLKELNLVSTENLQADLKRLGEVIEDKTEKIKRFKELNKEFGSDASKDAAGIDKRAKAIRDWANSTDFAIEASKTLTNAWGDLSAAGEDHMKIRNRSKYIEDYGKALEENVAHIKNYYHELETLDEIYKECSDKQRATIDDYKMWEKNKDKLLEYNKAINEYMRTLRDTGGEIDSKFLDELGNFSPQKFIDNFEKMGASSVVLSKQINAVKIELLESIKQYKDNADAARDNAKAVADNAKEVLDAANAKKDAIQAEIDHAKKLAQTATTVKDANKAVEESREAYKKMAEVIKEVEKAQEDYNQAARDADNWDERRLQTLKEQIQDYNRLAKAMREIGMAAQDLGREDIEKFDKSLASMLNRIGTFDNDIPSTFADIKEDIKALFSDMDSLDFGGIFEGLKDIGAGILSKIPGPAKVAAAAIVALGVALKECAEAGVNQFTKGMGTVKSAISGIIGVARDVGQEVFDAFENITDMQMDFSSMIEIPINFESQMEKTSAIAGAEGAEKEELEKEARRLGATTRYSATEVGEAMEYMGMAGWTNDQILAESENGLSALESVLNLATVAGMDLGQASDFVTDGLTALNMEAEDAAYMVDILAKASTSSNTSVAQMQRAFTNCAPVAGTLGINLKDLSLALGLMADKGVKGAKAGTALKNLMANMASPTEKQLAVMKKFNLVGAQQKITTGDLAGGLKEMKAALSGLEPKQQAAIITAIAGKEALSGVSALLNTTDEDLAKLEGALNDCGGAAEEMAGKMDDTVKGALKGLASAMQEGLLQIFDRTKGSIKEVTKQLTEFFNIWTGMSSNGNGSGLADALVYLEEASQGWGQAITDGLTKAIGAIDEFINNGSLDKVLQIGTNIINGICNGIQNAIDNGTLGSAITTAIGKIATWFSENLDTIVEVGKQVIDAISNGISDNSDAIGEVIKSVIDMQTTIDNSIAYEKWKFIGANLGTFIWKGFTSKVTELFSGIGGFFTGLGDLMTVKTKNPNTGKEQMFIPDPTGMTAGTWIDVEENTNKNNKKKDTKKTTTKKTDTKKNTDVGETVNNNLKEAKVKTDTTASEIGQGISDNIVKKLETMNTGDLAALREEMMGLQKTVTALGTGMATSFTTIQNSARTSFMGIANIVRNQMLNCTNIIRNQMVNSANIFRNQFINMTNITRNQMLNISNIVNNQAKNARDNLTRQFISMAKVVATQMNKCVSSVRSSMGQISSATNKSMSININRTITTGFAGDSGAALSANALYAANAASTYSLGGSTGALSSRASSVASGSGTGSSNSGRGMSDGQVIHMHVDLDGREIAKATAKYVDGELKTMASRENRKRGAK